jgi:hypothetical protein
MTPEPITGIPDDEIESIEVDPDKLGEFRQQCAQAWLEHAKEGWELGMLRGGPLDTMAAPRNPGAKDWRGAWADDTGRPILVSYEWAKDEGEEHWHGEYAGTRDLTDLASETMEDEFEKERAQPEPELVDLDSMTNEEALAFLKGDNERRITELLELSDGQLDLEHAHDLMFVKIFVNRILLFMSPQIHAEAQLEFENLRSCKFDEIEDKYNEFQAERERALAQARLSMQGPPPGMAPPGVAERVVLPSRRIRRSKG